MVLPSAVRVTRTPSDDTDFVYTQNAYISVIWPAGSSVGEFGRTTEAGPACFWAH